MSVFVPLSDILVTPRPPEWSELGRPVLERFEELTRHGERSARVSLPRLAEGEHYRFHLDTTRCIGCRSCEVACNEQNNNPPEVAWRRVGEVEGGDYPHTMRLYLSMACNHCLEPACLEGCPVDAYEKLANGIVAHDAEACIGCQYCNWSCPYGVPQYHPERRVVTKCNLCAERLEGGVLPACVQACPTGAIEIEGVDPIAWRESTREADAPGAPPADLTLSTTRITLPEELPDDMGRDAVELLEPESAHWSLVIFLVLSQWGGGFFATATLLAADRLAAFFLALAALSLTGLALAAALFHLGRPLFAWRAVRAWRRSWLSREVIAFGALSGFGALAVGMLGSRLLGAESPVLSSDAACTIVLAVTAATAAAGVVSSAGIYRLPARPAWNSRRTTVSFFATAILLGAISTLFLLAMADAFGQETARAGTAKPLAWALALAGAGAGIVQALVPWHLVAAGLASEDFPLRGAAILLTRRFAAILWLRTLGLSAVAVLAPAAVLIDGGGAAAATSGAALLLALSAEIAGRYLFFVTVVPRNIPGNFFSTRRTKRP